MYVFSSANANNALLRSTGFMTRYGCMMVGVLHPTHLSLTALHERQPLLIKRMLSSWIASVTVMAAYRTLVAGTLLRESHEQRALRKRCACALT